MAARRVTPARPARWAERRRHAKEAGIPGAIVAIVETEGIAATAAIVVNGSIAMDGVIAGIADADVVAEARLAAHRAVAVV